MSLATFFDCGRLIACRHGRISGREWQKIAITRASVCEAEVPLPAGNSKLSELLAAGYR